MVGKVLSETILLIDEADGLISNKNTRLDLADAVAVVGLSATFGGS